MFTRVLNRQIQPLNHTKKDLFSFHSIYDCAKKTSLETSGAIFIDDCLTIFSCAALHSVSISLDTLQTTLPITDSLFISFSHLFCTIFTFRSQRFNSTTNDISVQILDSLYRNDKCMSTNEIAKLCLT